MRAFGGRLTNPRFAGIHMTRHVSFARRNVVVIFGSRHTGYVVVVKW